MKNMYEIFEEFEKAPSKETKQAVLRKNYNSVVESVLRGTYHPKVKYVIERVPYYKPDKESPVGMSYSNMATEIQRAYLFEQNHPRVSPNLTQDKKEKLLIEILETLESKEAIVYMNMILKREQAKGLDYKFVKETFPDLLP